MYHNIGRDCAPRDVCGKEVIGKYGSFARKRGDEDVEDDDRISFDNRRNHAFTNENISFFTHFFSSVNTKKNHFTLITGANEIPICSSTVSSANVQSNCGEHARGACGVSKRFEVDDASLSFACNVVVEIYDSDRQWRGVSSDRDNISFFSSQTKKNYSTRVKMGNI